MHFNSVLLDCKLLGFSTMFSLLYCLFDIFFLCIIDGSYIFAKPISVCDWPISSVIGQLMSVCCC